MKFLSSDSENDQEQLPNEPDVIEIEPDPKSLIPVEKRVALAWLCFDKEHIYKRDKKEYIKCMKENCRKEFVYNRSTSTNLTRHVKDKHRSLLLQNQVKEMKHITIFLQNYVQLRLYWILG